MADDPNQKPTLSPREMAEQAAPQTIQDVVSAPKRAYEAAGQNLSNYNDMVHGAMSGDPEAQQSLAEHSLGVAASLGGGDAPPKSPGMYSRLQQTIEQKMGGSATPEQVLGMLREVKPEELQYSGVHDFLQGKSKVGKDELLAHVQSNLPQIKEVTKGSGQNATAHVQQDDEGFWHVTDPESGHAVIDEAGNTLSYYSTEDEAEQALQEMGMVHHEDDATKFSQYTLPGGENYREVLYTLPEKGTDVLPEGFSYKFDPSKKVGLQHQILNSDGQIAGLGDSKEATIANLRAVEKPNGDAVYRSPHWDEPNVLAHTRLSDRTDLNGEKHLLVEEVQSDWHQEGRKKGYGEAFEKPENTLSPEEIHRAGENFTQKLGPIEKEVQQYSTEKREALYQQMRDNPPELKRMIGTVAPSIQEAYNRGVITLEDLKGMEAANSQRYQQPIRTGKVPDAPFKKTWHEFAMKRLLKDAAEQGYDRLSWTPGEAQAARYDLSKQISEVHYSGSNLKAYDHEGNTVLNQTGVQEPDLENYIGKEAAGKLLAQPKKGTLRSLSGQDLKVGGEGMKGFYDKILPDFMNKLAKKYGSKVEASHVETPGGTAPVHSVKITPEMRKEILTKGLPMFAVGGSVQSFANGGGVAGQAPPIQQPPTQDPQLNAHTIPGVPVINPDGEIVAIDPEDLPRALDQGYTQASPQDVHKHIVQQKYGSFGQQVIAAVEGAAQSNTFGLSTPIEEGILGVKKEDIRGREEAGPGHTIGSVAGLLVPGSGEAALLREGGEMAAKAAGLGLKGGFLDQVGSHAVQGTFEAGLFQGGDEIHKAFTEDPHAVAEHAVADLGLATVLGGVLGGPFGAAAYGMKKAGSLLPSFVSELDRGAMESGDFAASIRGNNLLKDEEKANILSGLTKEKADAPEIRAAAKTLGAPVLDSMLADSPWVEKAADSLVNGAPTFSGMRVAQKFRDAYGVATNALDSVLGAEGQYSKAELGNVLKDSITANLEEQNAPIKQMYDQLKASQETIPLEQGLIDKLPDQISKLQEVRLAPSSPEGSLANRVIKELPNIKTVDDIKAYKSTLSVSPTASSGEKRMAGILRDMMTDIEEGSVERHAFNSATTPDAQREILSLIDQRKAANSAYKEFIGKVKTLSEQLGKGKVYGAQDAINFIRERVTPEELVQKLFSKKDSEFLKFFSKEFPDEMELMKNYQKSELREAASKTGVFSPKVFFNNVNKLEPEIQRAIFNPDELKTIKASETYIRRAFPKNFNPSGTSGMEAFRKLFEHPVGAAMSNARDYGIEKFLKLVSQSPDVKGAQELARATVRGWKSLGRGIRAVIDPAQEAIPSNVVDMQQSKREKLDKLVGEYQKNPDKMAKLGDNNPIPQYATAFAATSERAVQYLGGLKPNTTPQSPLDSKVIPSKTQEAAYNRALDLAQNPMGILKNVKEGSVTPQDIATVKAIYPSLYNSIATKLQTAIMASVTKGNVIPYRTRLGVSAFLMTPMDSTMAPQAIMSAQMALAQGSGGPQSQDQGQAPAAKHSMAALNKLPQGYQTANQAREGRNLRS